MDTHCSALIFIQNSNQAAIFYVTAENKGGASGNSQTGTGGCRQCVAVVGANTNLWLCMDRLAPGV